MTSTTTAPTLPDYAPVPTTALGPALNDQGYYVGRVERNLHWVTDVVGDVVLEVAARAGINRSGEFWIGLPDRDRRPPP